MFKRLNNAFNKISDTFSKVRNVFTKQTGQEKRKEKKQQKPQKPQKEKKKSKQPEKAPEPEKIPEPKKQKSKLAKTVENQLDKFRKVSITKQEVYRRMGIADDLVYKVNDKSISTKDIDRYLKSKGIDMIDFFLGSTANFKYNKKSYQKQKKKFNDKILELYRNEDIDDDYVDALNIMMFGADIGFDYNKLYK